MSALFLIFRLLQRYSQIYTHSGQTYAWLYRYTNNEIGNCSRDLNMPVLCFKYDLKCFLSVCWSGFYPDCQIFSIDCPLLAISMHHNLHKTTFTIYITFEQASISKDQWLALTPDSLLLSLIFQYASRESFRSPIH